jgi:putative ABC transport system permease protein
VQRASGRPPPGGPASWHARCFFRVDMPQIVKIALRNITRNKKRTAITLAAVFVGIFVIILVKGLLAGLHKSFVSELTESVTGDLQIQRRGYQEAMESAPLKLSVSTDTAFEDALREVPAVDAWAPRVRFAGIVSTGENSTMFIGLAADPVRELNVTPRVVASVAEGTYLRADRPNGILLSEELARSLGAKIGTELTLLANTREGSMNGRDVVLIGLLTSTMPNAPRKLLVMPLAAAQEMLFMEGRATEVTVHLKRGAPPDPAAEALERRLKASGQELVVRGWREAMGFFVQIMDLQNFVFGIVLGVLFLMVLTGIANTMLMTVFERTREIGTMMALGMRRRSIVAMFLAEATAIGLLGATLGIVAGGGTVLWLGRRGLSFVAPGTNAAWDIHPVLVPETVGIALGFAVVCSVISAAYPTWRAGRLHPVEALRG